MAAPGAENATITGTRSLSDGAMVRTAMPRHSAHTQEAIWSSSAPSDRAASKTRTMPLVNPTSDATKPAVIVDRAKSLKTDIRQS